MTIERTCPPDAPLWAVRFPSSINFTYAFKLFSDRGGFQRYREMKVLLTVTLNVLYFRRSHQSLVITTLVFTPLRPFLPSKDAIQIAASLGIPKFHRGGEFSWERVKETNNLIKVDALNPNYAIHARLG